MNKIDLKKERDKLSVIIRNNNLIILL